MWMWCKVVFYLAHLPEQNERSLKSFKPVFAQNAFCWAAMEDAVFAGTLYSIFNLNIWNLKTRDLKKKKIPIHIFSDVNKKDLFCILPAVVSTVHPGPLGSSRRGWCPHHCWSWNRRSPWWNLMVCSAQPQCCNCICRVCHYPAEVRHSHLKKHKGFMLWHILWLLSAEFWSVPCLPTLSVSEA